MYIADYGNKRVQVLDESGHFIRVFSEERIKSVIALHIVEKYVYMCEVNHILVYETSGQFVTSFAIGYDEWSRNAVSISSCADGFIYVSCWSRVIPGVIKIF